MLQTQLHGPVLQTQLHGFIGPKRGKLLFLPKQVTDSSDEIGCVLDTYLKHTNKTSILLSDEQLLISNRWCAC